MHTLYTNLLLASATLVAGCFTSGRCVSGETTHWDATVERVEVHEGYAVLHTQSGRTLTFSAELATACLEKGALAKGSTAVVESHSNGPCPPDEAVIACP